MDSSDSHCCLTFSGPKQGQDFENKTAHAQQEYPPGDLKPGSKFTCEHPPANYQML